MGVARKCPYIVGGGGVGADWLVDILRVVVVVCETAGDGGWEVVGESAWVAGG